MRRILNIFIGENFRLINNYLRYTITYSKYDPLMIGRSVDYEINLDEIEWYEDASISWFKGRKRLLIRYKSGSEYYHWIDICDFRKYYVKYLLWK